MFFAISKIKEENFSHQVNVGALVINMDAGWSVITTDAHILVYKGYADGLDLSSKIHQVASSNLQLDGNFALLAFNRHTHCISIKTSKYRSFPVYFDQFEKVTNLEILKNTAYADDNVTVTARLEVLLEKHDPIGTTTLSQLSEDQIVEQLHTLLDNKVKTFLTHNKLPVKVFLSGGVDSMLVYSFIKKHTKNYEIISGQIFEFDEFWCTNSKYITNNYWGYNQLHHWRAPSLLVTGAMGDEFTLRSPTTASVYLLQHSTTIPELAAQRPDYLHKKYFELDKNQQVFSEISKSAKLKELAKDQAQLYHQLCNINLNDFQHWHLGNTITFTPLLDLEIFKLFLQLPKVSAIEQILSSKITKRLIEKNDASLLQYLSLQKNNNALRTVWDYVKLTVK